MNKLMYILVILSVGLTGCFQQQRPEVQSLAIPEPQQVQLAPESTSEAAQISCAPIEEVPEGFLVLIDPEKCPERNVEVEQKSYLVYNLGTTTIIINDGEDVHIVAGSSVRTLSMDTNEIEVSTSGEGLTVGLFADPEDKSVTDASVCRWIGMLCPPTPESTPEVFECPPHIINEHGFESLITYDDCNNVEIVWSSDDFLVYNFFNTTVIVESGGETFEIEGEGVVRIRGNAEHFTASLTDPGSSTIIFVTDSSNRVLAEEFICEIFGEWCPAEITPEVTDS